MFKYQHRSAGSRRFRKNFHLQDLKWSYINSKSRQKSTIPIKRNHPRSWLFCIFYKSSYQVRQINQIVIPTIHFGWLPRACIAYSNHHRRGTNHRYHVSYHRYHQGYSSPNSWMHHYCITIHEKDHNRSEQSRPNRGS